VSALSLDEIAEVVRNRLNLAPADVPRIKTLIPGALKSLALKVARRADFEALRGEFASNIVNGVIALNNPAIILQVLPDTGVLLVNGQISKSAPSYHALREKVPNDIYRWALLGQTIHVKDINIGALGTVNQPFTLTYSRIPTLADIPDSYDDELADETVLLASGKVEDSAEPSFTRGDDSLSVNLNAN